MAEDASLALGMQPGKLKMHVNAGAQLWSIVALLL